MVNEIIKLDGLTLKNPVMTASGTFGYGLEYADFINLEDLGGIVVKVLHYIIERVILIREWQRHLQACLMPWDCKIKAWTILCNISILP